MPPLVLDRKYRNAACEWGWQWVFPASHLSVDPRSGIQRRHHLYESVPQRALKEAARKVGLAKPANPHILRHYVPCRIMSSKGQTFVDLLKDFKHSQAKPAQYCPT